MKTSRFVYLLVVMMLVFGPAAMAVADQYEGTIAVYKKTLAVKPFFENAYGFAVFPTVGKGAIGLGGAYGKGRVYRGGEVAGETTLVKASIGLQIGGQAFSEMIFFQDKRAYEEFTSGSFAFDATASAVAITAGAQAKAGTEGTTAGASAGPATGTQAPIDYYKGMAVFVHTKGGLMFEAAVGGQKFSFQPATKAQ